MFTAARQISTHR